MPPVPPEAGFSFSGISVTNASVVSMRAAIEQRSAAPCGPPWPDRLHQPLPGPRICRPETIVFRAGHCLSKARFLALLTRGVDLGIWFALAQGAVNCQWGLP
jgi:hypothetical protein